MARLVLDQPVDLALYHHGRELDRLRSFHERPYRLVPVPFLRLRLHALLNVVTQPVAQGVQRSEPLADLAGEVVIERRQLLLLHLFDGYGERPAFAGKRPLAFRDRYRDLFRDTLFRTDHPFGDAGQEDRCPFTQSQFGVVLLVHFLAVDHASHIRADDVAHLHRPLDRLVDGVPVLQLFQCLVHLALVNAEGLSLDTHALVLAKLDGRPDGHRRFKCQRFVIHQLDRRLVDSIDVLFLDRLVVGLRNEYVQRLPDDTRTTDMTLEHAGGRLSLAEAGHFHPLGKPPECLVQ